jgi:hypothetical protein
MRVKLKTKNKGIKVEAYDCRKCDQPIKPGERYYEWKHRNVRPSAASTQSTARRSSPSFAREKCRGSTPRPKS